MRAALLTVAMLAAAGPTSASASSLSSKDVVGVYFSSMLGGCWLRIRADRMVTGSCGDHRSLTGHVALSEKGAMIMAYVTDGYVPRPMQAVPPPEKNPSWPPPMSDPTLPLFGPDEPRAEALFLYPVRWGPRIYLVRLANLQDFCNAPDAAREPRSTAAGEEFLRKGHERLKVAKGVAPACNPASEPTD